MLLIWSMSFEHREAILVAATETFARYGFKKASVDDIARRAGIGKGTVYLHFESKEELFGAVVRRIWTRSLAGLEAALKQARTPLQKIRAFIDTRLRQNRQGATSIGVTPESLLELIAHAEPHRREARAQETALLEEIMREANAQGAFAVRSPRLVAAAVTACLHGLDAYLVGPGSLELQDALDEIQDVFVRGLLAPAAARPSRAVAPMPTGTAE
jgi:AcrR family transcriptional regulator